MPNGKMIGILRRFENDVYFICNLWQRMSFIFPLPCVMLSPPGELNFAVYLILCSCVTKACTVEHGELWPPMRFTAKEVRIDELLSPKQHELGLVYTSLLCRTYVGQMQFKQ